MAAVTPARIFLDSQLRELSLLGDTDCETLRRFAELGITL